MASRKSKGGRKKGGRSAKKSAYSETARRGISLHIRKHRKEGMPQRQAVAAALSEQRRKGRKVPSRRRSTATRTRSRRNR